MITDMPKEEILDQREVAYMMGGKNDATRNLALVKGFIEAWKLGFRERDRAATLSNQRDTSGPDETIIYHHFLGWAVDHPTLGLLSMRRLKELFDVAKEMTSV